MKQIENRLREIRKSRNLTQQQVAKVLGVVTSTYTQYELGTNKIPIDALIKLSDFYRVSVDYLIANPNKFEDEKFKKLKLEIDKIFERLKDE